MSRVPNWTSVPLRRSPSPLPEPGVNFALNSGPGMPVREAAFLCFMQEEGEFR